MNDVKRWIENPRFILLYLPFIMLLWSVQSIAQSCSPSSVTPSTPTSDFVDNGNGTVTHIKTGLVWKRCLEGQTWNGATCLGTAKSYTWQSVLQHTQALNAGGGYAGFTDWRLPNIKALNSIVETSCAFPSINSAIFPATPAFISGFNWTWSSRSDWAVNFVYGDNGGAGNYARLVRGGQ